MSEQHVPRSDYPRFHLAFPVTKLQSAAITFVIAPHVRFKGLPGEQATMFFLDPFDNALEFKAFEHVEQLFAKQ